MRTFAMLVLAFAMTLAAASAQAQTTIRITRYACRPLAGTATPFPAVIHRWPSADGPHPAARRNASPTRTSRHQIRAVPGGNTGRINDRSEAAGYHQLAAPA